MSDTITTIFIILIVIFLSLITSVYIVSAIIASKKTDELKKHMKD